MYPFKLGAVSLLLAASATFVTGAPFSTTNLVVNPGGETGTLAGWTTNADPRIDSGTFDPGINPHSGSFDIAGGTSTESDIFQTITLVGNQGLTAAKIDTGTLFARLSFWSQVLNKTTADTVTVFLNYQNSSHGFLGQSFVPNVSSVSTWSNSVAYFKLPASTRFIQYQVHFTYGSGSKLDAFIDDNSVIVTDTGELPTLNINAAGNNVVVSWLTNFAAQFVIQSNTNLSTTNWATYSGTLFTGGGSNWITVPPAIGRQFFRLRHP